MLIAGKNDLTVHFELDINIDLKPALEDFTKLTQIGDFHSARNYFEDNLRDYVEAPYVFLCYAVMLLDMGNYKELSKLDFDFRGLETEIGSRALNIFQKTLDLTKACSSLHTNKTNLIHLDDWFYFEFTNVDVLIESVQVGEFFPYSIIATIQCVN